MKMKSNFLVMLIAAASFAGLAYASVYVNNEAGETVKEEDQSRSLRIGDKAPELAFKDPEGNIRKLSDLRGNIVLIDFWASWCRPCRYENPNVVKTYKDFQDANFKNAEGFEIYSVSLDRNKQDWVKAIKADGLLWDNHVSDLAFWNSEGAKIYGVRGIPATYLIDAEGIIIAKNLRGEALRSTLNKLTE